MNYYTSLIYKHLLFLYVKYKQRLYIVHYTLRKGDLMISTVDKITLIIYTMVTITFMILTFFELNVSVIGAYGTFIVTILLLLSLRLLCPLNKFCNMTQ